MDGKSTTSDDLYRIVIRDHSGKLLCTIPPAGEVGIGLGEACDVASDWMVDMDEKGEFVNIEITVAGGDLDPTVEEKVDETNKP